MSATTDGPAAPADDEASLAVPRSPGELFVAFTVLAMQGFGGVIAVAQRELVERRRWVTREQFVELLSVSQMLPGPNVVNLSLMTGDRFFGWRGAVAALAGMLLLPLAVVLALTVTYHRFAGHPAVAGALTGMNAVAAGLIVATAIKLARTLGGNPLGLRLSALLAGLTIAAVTLARLPLALVLAVLGPLSYAIAWWKLPR